MPDRLIEAVKPPGLMSLGDLFRLRDLTFLLKNFRAQAMLHLLGRAQTRVILLRPNKQLPKLRRSIGGRDRDDGFQLLAHARDCSGGFGAPELFNQQRTLGLPGSRAVCLELPTRLHRGDGRDSAVLPEECTH
jgi:hypothetical protein